LSGDLSSIPRLRTRSDISRGLRRLASHLVQNEQHERFAWDVPFAGDSEIGGELEAEADVVVGVAQDDDERKARGRSL
jgi:hypothetical protein